MRRPKINWKAFAKDVRKLLRNWHDSSIREGAMKMGISHSALQRAVSGKPLVAANYVQIILWLGCDAEKYLTTKFKG